MPNIVIPSQNLTLTGSVASIMEPMPLSVGIKDLIVEAGLAIFGATSGWAVFVSREPNSPDTVITCYDTGGFPANPKFLLDFPTIMTRIRGAKGGYLAAWRKANAVRDILLGIGPRILYGTRWVSVTLLGDVAQIGYDDNERPLLTVNYNLIVEPAVSAVGVRESL